MEEFVTMSDGAHLWTATSGEGPPIVLLGGGPGMADYLAPVSALLDDRYTVHRYEQRGCGGSDRQLPYSLARFIEDLDMLRCHWNYDRWIVAGHSWGADLALAYALQKPEAVTALIGLAGGRIHNDRSWHAIYQENRNKEQLPRTKVGPNLEVNRALIEDWRAYCREPAILFDLAHLKTPALFAYGDSDIRPAWPTRQIARLIPNAKFVLLPNADHNLWAGNPEDLGRALTNFLNEF